MTINWRIILEVVIVKVFLFVNRDNLRVRVGIYKNFRGDSVFFFVRKFGYVRMNEMRVI